MYIFFMNLCVKSIGVMLFGLLATLIRSLRVVRTIWHFLFSSCFPLSSTLYPLSSKRSFLSFFLSFFFEGGNMLLTLWLKEVLG